MINKPGFIQVIECHLDRITNPEPIVFPLWPGARMMPCGGTGETCLGIKIPRKGGPKTGNQKTAKWRKRRGGAYCSPLNTKFK